MRNTLRALLALSLLLAPGTAPAAASGGLGQIPTGGPVSGPIEVFANASVISTPLGTLIDSDIAVENDASVPVSVYLIGQLDWPDGSSQLLRIGPPTAIAPGGAFLVFATSLVPDGVGSGPGSLTVTAFVTRIDGGRGGFTGALIASDSAGFTLP